MGDSVRLYLKTKENTTMNLTSMVRYALVLLLVLNFLGLGFISVINPESYFFGAKLGGINASLYLLTNGVVGVVIAYALLIRKKIGKFLSAVYFGYNFSEGLITNLSFGWGSLISPVFTLGLILSIVLLMKREKR